MPQIPLKKELILFSLKLVYWSSNNCLAMLLYHQKHYDNETAES